MSRKTPRWKAYVAGMAGGAAGTLAMGFYMKGMKSLKHAREESRSGNGGDGQGGEARAEEAAGQPQAEKRNPEAEHPKEHDVSIIGRKHREGESATAALGRIAYQTIAKKEPEDRVKSRLSNAVHWSYGTEMGAAYGLIRGRRKSLDLLGGLAYGGALWAIGDEIAVPLLGLAEGPKAHPVSLHAETFGAHLIYGVTTAAATQLLERVL